MLLALVPSQIIQSLTSIKISDITIDTERIKIFISDFMKNSVCQTISRLIKTCLSKSGMDTGYLYFFSPYSTRHTSTSKALRGGISIDTIRKVAGWSTQSGVFAKFYNKPLLNEEVYARSFLSG